MFFDVGTKYHTKSDHKTKQNVPILNVEKIKFLNQNDDVNCFKNLAPSGTDCGFF